MFTPNPRRSPSKNRETPSHQETFQPKRAMTRMGKPKKKRKKMTRGMSTVKQPLM